MTAKVPMDMNGQLMLDGNAAAGTLADVFGADMTVAPAKCAHCGNVARMAELKAFMQTPPGAVLRCPACLEVVVRVAATPGAFYLDARGAEYLRIARPGR
jgi:hypothetical protein